MCAPRPGRPAAVDMSPSVPTGPDPVVRIAPLMIGVALLVAVLVAVGVALQLDKERRAATERLELVSALRTRQVTGWLEQRRRAAEFLVAGVTVEGAQRPAQELVDRRAIERRLDGFARVAGFLGAQIVDASTASIAPTPAAASTASVASAASAVSAAPPASAIAAVGRVPAPALRVALAAANESGRSRFTEVLLGC